MKTQSLLITLCITTLTACAVDKNDSDQTAASPESEMRTELRSRELIGQAMNDEQVIIATPMPLEEKAQGERGKTEPDPRRDMPVATAEYDAVAASKYMSADRMMLLKQSNAQISMVSPSSVQHSIRHASEPLYREKYLHPDSQNVLRVSSNPVSTFSIDVDTGAYSNMRAAG